MSQRAFTVADTHFFHDKALKFRANMGWSTVEDMNEELIYRWNHVVRPQDTVVHLGDVALCSGDPDKLIALDDVMLRLNGRLVLVMGNHDNMAVAGKYFDLVYGVRERKNCILSHIPVHPSQKKRFRLNIHGHLHHDVVPDILEVRTATAEGFPPLGPDPWYHCVSVEQTDYAPVAFQDIIYEHFGRRHREDT